MKKLISGNLYLFLFIGLTLIFFSPFFLFGKIPIPADTIVGMYHPFRDRVWDGYKTGVPFKNFLITDPVRQQYVWRNLAVEELKKGNFPLWNPYSFSGTPLLANFQTASFYPFNILFFILPFNLAWGTLVVLQPILAGVFLYMYLRFLKIGQSASFLGAVTFAFCGFAISWLEWNTVIHTALWLPLILLSIEKIVQRRVRPLEKSRPDPILFLWSLIFLLSLVSSFFAGHLQIFFYSFLITIVYIVIRVFSLKRNRFKTILFFVLCSLFFVIITFIQWFPTLQFILLSARDIDQGLWFKPGWFIPWQNLIQFMAPDFFGNPATGNYWGVWNYAEFVGFIGVIPLLMALLAMIWRKDKKTMFFGTIFFLSLIFATPTFLAKLPYKFKIPFISTSQPTRLLFLADFSLAVLASLGFDYFIKSKNLKVQIIRLLGGMGIIYGLLWFFVLFYNKFGLTISPENILIAKRNLILPTILFILGGVSLIVLANVKNNLLKLFFVLCSLFFVLFDLFRFGWKFLPFTKPDWIFPETKIINILNQDKETYRIMSLDRRIMPPNFSVYYKFQDVAGYDPLYLRSYSEFVAAWERDKPDISLASFNRIITPINYESFFTDLLGIKYLLSLNQIHSEKLELIATEGQTYLYKNHKVFPRVFFVEQVQWVDNENEAIKAVYRDDFDPRVVAVAEKESTNILGAVYKTKFSKGTAEITKYLENRVTIKTANEEEGFLVFTDDFYPSWRVKIISEDIPYSFEGKIYRTNFNFRGIFVPKGKNLIIFYPCLF